MATQMKWILPLVLLILFIFFITYTFGVQNKATHSTSEIEVLAETLSVGIIRGEIEEGQDDFSYFDKEELVANLISKVAEVQNKHKYDIVLDYVFLDREGETTVVDEEIRGLQFRIQYKDQGGKVRGTAERRLALNYPDMQ